MVPVLHIVGAPSTIQQKTRPLLHHTLGDGRLFISLIQIPIHLLTKSFRFEAYETAAALFTSSQVNIVDKKDAASQIDQVITDCITQVWSLFSKMVSSLKKFQARPVYLTLPTDMVFQQISSERLKIPISPALLSHHPKVEDFVINLIHERVTAAGGDVIVLADACVIRHGVRKKVVDFLHETGFPVYATPMGKTAIDENDKRYGGVQIVSQSKLRMY